MDDEVHANRDLAALHGCRVARLSETVKAKKITKGKDRVDLLPVLPLLEVAHVFDVGSQKEGRTEWDWKRGERWSVYAGALLRHFFKWILRRPFDPDTGKSHMASVVSNAMILLDFELRGIGTDDREGGLNA